MTWGILCILKIHPQLITKWKLSFWVECNLLNCRTAIPAKWSLVTELPSITVEHAGREFVMNVQPKSDQFLRGDGEQNQFVSVILATQCRQIMVSFRFFGQLSKYVYKIWSPPFDIWLACVFAHMQIGPCRQKTQVSHVSNGSDHVLYLWFFKMVFSLGIGMTSIVFFCCCFFLTLISKWEKMRSGETVCICMTYYWAHLCDFHGGSYASHFLCLSACLGLWDICRAPLQRYRATLCTIHLRCAPQGRRYSYVPSCQQHLRN